MEVPRLSSNSGFWHSERRRVRPQVFELKKFLPGPRQVSFPRRANRSQGNLVNSLRLRGGKTDRPMPTLPKPWILRFSGAKCCARQRRTMPARISVYSTRCWRGRSPWNPFFCAIAGIVVASSNRQYRVVKPAPILPLAAKFHTFLKWRPKEPSTYPRPWQRHWRREVQHPRRVTSFTARRKSACASASSRQGAPARSG